MAKSGASSRLRQPGDGGSTDTRRVLVDAAIETLKSEGFAGASARAIAGRAGLQPGSGLLPLRVGGQPVAGRPGCGERRRGCSTTARWSSG